MDEIQTIYCGQFPFMRQYEAETYYDATGRIVFTPSKGLIGVGLPRKAIKGDASYTLKTPDGTKEGIALSWEDICDLNEDTVTSTQGKVRLAADYYAPFDSVSREIDYAVTSTTVWSIRRKQ